MSGRNSFRTPNPTFHPMLMPKLEAASPKEDVLGGCQDLERYAPPANPISRDTDGYRFPLSWRASMPLDNA